MCQLMLYTNRLSGLWQSVMASGVGGDVRYSLGRLLRTPATTAAIVATLALGVGANAALFNVINSVLFKSFLPSAARDLVVIGSTLDGQGGLTSKEIEAVRIGGAEQFGGFGGVRMVRLAVTVGDRSTRVLGESVFGEYFAALGVEPLRGRLLQAADDASVSGAVCVVSERLATAIGSTSGDLLGRNITVADQSVTVVGIVAGAFRGLNAPNVFGIDVWIPSRVLPEGVVRATGSSVPRMNVFARLRPGVTTKQATQYVRALLQDSQPRVGTATWTVVPLRAVFSDNPPVFFVAAAALLSFAALVLFITCANVANLLLASVSGRTLEISVRIALGASTTRIARLVIMETVIVLALGTALGIMVSVAVPAALSALPPADTNGWTPHLDLAPDWRVFGYASLAPGLAAFLMGAMLARRAVGVEAIAAMTAAAGIGGATSRQEGLRVRLMAGQVAGVFVLLATAALLHRVTSEEARRFQQFETSNAIVGNLDFRLSGFDATRATVARRRILESAATAPGVTGAAFASALPGPRIAGRLRVERADPTGGAGVSGLESPLISISQDFFRVVGLVVARGRSFSASDTAGSEPVVIVSEGIASELWPGGDAIGSLVRLGKGERDELLAQVVGVVVDPPRQRATRRSEPVLYVPLEQRPSAGMALVLLTSGPGPYAERARTLSAAVAAVEPGVPAALAGTVSDQAAQAVSGQRWMGVVATALALLGLTVAVVGLYGVVARMVAERARELAIRRSLGASAGDIYWLVGRDGLRMVCLGLAAGIPLAVVTGYSLRSMLIDVKPYDLTAFGEATLVILVVAVGACMLPVWSLLRREPQTALRSGL